MGLSATGKAREERVLRPLRILAAMQKEQRREIAEFLEFEFAEESLGNPKAEAWEIINCDLRGLQARTHEWHHTISPFSGNNSWHEILTCVAEGLKLDMSDRARDQVLESAICEAVAKGALEEMEPAQRMEVDRLIAIEPGLVERLRDQGLRPNTVKLVMSGALRAAEAGGFGTFVTAVKAAAWLNRTVGTKIVMSTATKAVATAMQAVNVALWVWLAVDILDLLFGTSVMRVAPVVAQIHLFDKFSTAANT